MTDIMGTSWGKLAQKIRVPAGTLIGIAFLLLMHPSRNSLWLGGAITLTGALLRLWSAGHIEKGRVLACSGPYALTRNPLYLGSFLMAIGVLLAGQGYWLVVPFILFFAVIYFPVMKAEEIELRSGLGGEFDRYCEAVPLFVPRFGTGHRVLSGFLWSRVVKNREHRNLLGLVVAELFLVLRWLI
jgi:protein-S-isoprenylcysteine O-methyltransferase Ste14